MGRPLWFVELIKKPFAHRFFLAEMTKLPLVGRLVDHLLFAGDSIFYLPSDRVIRVDEPIDQPQGLVLPSQVVEHFIQQASHHWIMNECICRDASQCQDYPIDLGCLFLGEAVRGINPELGRLVTRHQALEHVRRCREAGLVHMIGRNKLDTVWLGVGPGDKLLTVCNCCPCCCIWRMLPNITAEIGSRVTRVPGIAVVVTDACVGCGTCTQDVCFVQAIHLVDGRAVIDEACRGCGRCVTACPQTAIELIIEDQQYVEHAIDWLSSRVDVA